MRNTFLSSKLQKKLDVVNMIQIRTNIIDIIFIIYIYFLFYQMGQETLFSINLISQLIHGSGFKGLRLS